MINLKEETKLFLQDKTILRANIYNEYFERDFYDEEEIREHWKQRQLKKWYLKEDLENFLESLNFEYDNWFWWQRIYWYIVFNDWTRIERHEYDWSEWREYKETPKYPF